MNGHQARQGEIPIAPVYSFNKPGEAVELFDGEMEISGHKALGRVELSCFPELEFLWQVQSTQSFPLEINNCLEISFTDSSLQRKMEGRQRGVYHGWTEGGEFVNENQRIARVVAHWFNVPKFSGNLHLSHKSSFGEETFSARSRWSHNIAGWRVTIDARPDLSQIWESLDDQPSNAMTHVMEIKREDDRTFSITEAQTILFGLHLSMSFALGTWVAPMLAVGFSPHNNRVWEEWRPRFCSPGRSTAAGWWYPWDNQALSHFLSKSISTFLNPAKHSALKFRIQYALSSMQKKGFVEQRIIAAAAGLEHIMWEKFVLSGTMTKAKYKSQPAHTLLRRLLQDAKIPTAIDPNTHPQATSFINANPNHLSVNDGPELFTWVRNRLVHPQGNQDPVYSTPGLVVEAWLLGQSYLSLMILHSLDYRGKHQHLDRLDSWAGETAEVPWV